MNAETAMDAAAAEAHKDAKLGGSLKRRESTLAKLLQMSLNSALHEPVVNLLNTIKRDYSFYIRFCRLHLPIVDSEHRSQRIHYCRCAFESRGAIFGPDVQ